MARPLWAVLLAAALCAAGGAARAQDAPASKFLTPGDLDPARILAAPAADGSPRAAAELADLRRLASERTAERLAQARRDDQLEDVRSISPALGGDFAAGLEAGRYPATARLFADLRAEDAVAYKRAKAYFQRERPFFHDKALDVCDDGSDRKNSYPSGHAAIGWSAALMLADLAPAHAPEVLARAGDYAESRLYCGVHYRSDVEASHVLAVALDLKLMEKPAFRAEVDAARAELVAAGIR